MTFTKKMGKYAWAIAVGLSAAQMALAETADPSLQQAVAPVDISHDDDAAINQQEEPEKLAEGFVEGSALTLTSRNYYFNRDYRNVPSTDQSFQEEWAQGEMLEYQSGYTKGVVGFGVDAYGYAGFKLDSGKGRTSQGGSIVGLLPVNSQGDPEDSYGESGAAVKMRISATELKYGEMRTAAPVFATGDAFLLPETATGFLATSSDIENLTLEAGHFTRFNDYNSTNSDGDIRPSYGSGKPGNAISFAGATYTISDDATLMLYGSHYEDNWNQYFVNANYGIPLSEEQKLVFDLNVYRSLNTGSSNQGAINNTSSSLKASYIVGIHTIDLAQQHIHGDTPFDYIGWNSIWLANSNQYSDFNAPGEDSTSLAYTIDLADLVAPGLTAMAKYTKGTDIDGTDADPAGGYAGYYGNNGHQWERDFDVKYLVPSGTFKDLSIRLRQATHRGNTDQGDGAIDEVRLSFTYPWELL